VKSLKREEIRMLNPAAEKSYEKGLDALERVELKEALAYFEAAVAIEKRSRKAPLQPRYLSYYGLCIGLVGKQMHSAVKLCAQACAMERYNPDLEWNLGRVYMAAGRPKEAHAAFVRGLRQERRHQGIWRELHRMGVRKRPVFKFLSRTNPLNVFLGRKRSGQKSAA